MISAEAAREKVEDTILPCLSLSLCFLLLFVSPVSSCTPFQQPRRTLRCSPWFRSCCDAALFLCLSPVLSFLTTAPLFSLRSLTFFSLSLFLCRSSPPPPPPFKRKQVDSVIDFSRERTVEQTAVSRPLPSLPHPFPFLSPLRLLRLNLLLRHLRIFSTPTSLSLVPVLECCSHRLSLLPYRLVLSLSTFLLHSPSRKTEKL